MDLFKYANACNKAQRKQAATEGARTSEASGRSEAVRNEQGASRRIREGAKRAGKRRLHSSLLPGG